MLGTEAFALEPLEDQDEQDLFLSVLYHDARGGHAIRMLLGDQDKDKPVVRHYASKDYKKIDYRSLQYDAYTTVNTFRAYERKADQVYNYSGIFIDLDGHNFKSTETMDAAIERTKERLKRAFLEGEITAPTMITHTGRGLGVFYILRTSIANTSKARKSIQYLDQVRAALTAKYKRILNGRGYLEVDMTVKDAARVCRIPLTYNSRAERWCRLIHVSRDDDGDVAYCSLEELARDSHLFDKINEIKKQIASRKVVSLDAYRVPFLTIRIQKLQMLQELRGYDCSGCREYMIFAFYNASKQIYGEVGGKSATKEFNAKFKVPLTDAELNHAYKVTDDNVSPTGDYEGYYKLPDAWILDVLQVSAAENAKVHFGASKREIERQETKDRNARAKQDRNAAVVKEILEHPEKTYQQIAEIYGISAKTVQRIAADQSIKRYRKAEDSKEQAVVSADSTDGTNGQKMSKSPVVSDVLSLFGRVREGQTEAGDIVIDQEQDRAVVRLDGLIQAYADLYAPVTERKRRRRQTEGQISFRFDATGGVVYYASS